MIEFVGSIPLILHVISFSIYIEKPKARSETHLQQPCSIHLNLGMKKASEPHFAFFLSFLSSPIPTPRPRVEMPTASFEKSTAHSTVYSTGRCKRRPVESLELLVESKTSIYNLIELGL